MVEELLLFIHCVKCVHEEFRYLENDIQLLSFLRCLFVEDLNSLPNLENSKKQTPMESDVAVYKYIFV